MSFTDESDSRDDHLTVDFGPGSTPPSLTNVQCTGNEMSLNECTSQVISDNFNNTCYAAGVMCAGKC